MPLYSYTAADGSETIQIESPIQAKRPEKIKRKGKTFHRDVAADHCGLKRSMLSGWPQRSDALGIHPKQIAEAKAADKKAGVPIDYAADGAAIFTGPEQKYRYMRAMGYIDRNGVRSGRHA